MLAFPCHHGLGNAAGFPWEVTAWLQGILSPLLPGGMQRRGRCRLQGEPPLPFSYLSRETVARVKLLAYMVRKMKKWTALHMKGPNTHPSRV